MFLHWNSRFDSTANSTQFILKEPGLGKAAARAFQNQTIFTRWPQSENACGFFKPRILDWPGKVDWPVKVGIADHCRANRFAEARTCVALVRARHSTLLQKSPLLHCLPVDTRRDRQSISTAKLENRPPGRRRDHFMGSAKSLWKRTPANVSAGTQRGAAMFKIINILYREYCLARLNEMRRFECSH